LLDAIIILFQKKIFTYFTIIATDLLLIKELYDINFKLLTKIFYQQNIDTYKNILRFIPRSCCQNASRGSLREILFRTIVVCLVKNKCVFRFYNNMFFGSL